MATDQQLDIRVHGAQQTQSPVHGGIIPPHGGKGGAGIGPVHGLNGNAGLVNATLWSAANSSPNFTISGAGLIATHSVTGTDNLVRGSNGYSGSVGDHSFILTSSAGGAFFFGLATLAELVSGNFCGSTPASIGYFNTDGNIYRNNATVSTPAVTYNLEPITIRIKNGKLYVAKSGGYIGTMNPVAETGGVDVSGMGTLYPAASINAAAAFTADFTNW